MNILLFGGTGSLGRHLLGQLLAAGHKVAVFARTPAKITLTHPNVSVLQGDLLDERDVFDALEGRDAVINAVGGAFDSTVRSEGLRNILLAMNRHGVRRILSVGGPGILDAGDGMVYERPSFPPMLVPVTEEHRRGYEQLLASGTDWTLVCPPMMKEGPATSKYRVQADVPLSGGWEMPLADVAAFMVRELRQGKFIGKRVAIASA